MLVLDQVPQCFAEAGRDQVGRVSQENRRSLVGGRVLPCALSPVSRERQTQERG